MQFFVHVITAIRGQKDFPFTLSRNRLRAAAPFCCPSTGAQGASECIPVIVMLARDGAFRAGNHFTR
jgi:hypothetical protein